MKHSAFNLNTAFTLLGRSTLYVILIIIGTNLSIAPIQAQDNLKIKDASNNLIFEAKEIGVRVGDSGLGVEGTFQLNSDAAGVPFLSSPWIYTQALQARSERGASGTAIILGADENRSEGDEIHLITNGDDRIVVKPDGGVGVGTNTPEPSAIMDVSSTSKGFLLPRLTSQERDAVDNPATGLVIYNTTEEALQLFLGTFWVNISTAPCASPGIKSDISGYEYVDENQQGVVFTIAPQGVAPDYYHWTVPAGASIIAGEGTTTITVDFGTNEGDVEVYGSNGCGITSTTSKSIQINEFLSGVHNVRLPDNSLIYVSTVDQNTGGRWSTSNTNVTALPDLIQAAAQGDFEGESNTNTIYAHYSSGLYAAQRCKDLVQNGYNDWYLPALGELSAIYEQLGPNGTNNITSNYYWSSSEKNTDKAWTIRFDTGNTTAITKSSATNLSCRCVRKN